MVGQCIGIADNTTIRMIDATSLTISVCKSAYPDVDMISIRELSCLGSTKVISEGYFQPGSCCIKNRKIISYFSQFGILRLHLCKINWNFFYSYKLRSCITVILIRRNTAVVL